jgi:CBS domain-containing protein
MKIKDVMKKAVCTYPDTKKKDLFLLAKANPDAELFVVIDAKGKFLGDIHENDLFLMMIPNSRAKDIESDDVFDFEKKFFAENAKEIMRKHDVTCTEDEDIMDVAVRLAGEEINEMPVLDKQGTVVGIITEGILLRYLQ